MVRADREKFVQVPLNLLSNAVKFTEPGGEITISCEQDGTEVRVAVTDSGLGIPADKLEEITLRLASPTMPPETAVEARA